MQVVKTPDWQQNCAGACKSLHVSVKTDVRRMDSAVHVVSAYRQVDAVAHVRAGGKLLLPVLQERVLYPGTRVACKPWAPQCSAWLLTACAITIHAQGLDEGLNRFAAALQSSLPAQVSMGASKRLASSNRNCWYSRRARCSAALNSCRGLQPSAGAAEMDRAPKLGR